MLLRYLSLCFQLALQYLLVIDTKSRGGTTRQIQFLTPLTRIRSWGMTILFLRLLTENLTSFQLIGKCQKSIKVKHYG